MIKNSFRHKLWRRTSFGVSVILGVTSLGGVAVAAQAAPVSEPGIRYSFESGTLEGWKVLDGNFEKLIAANDLNQKAVPASVPRVTGNASQDKVGKFFLSTAAKNDGFTSSLFYGHIESPEFVLHEPKITLRVGGSRVSSSYVGVIDENGKLLASTTGINRQELVAREFYLPDQIGKKLRLVVRDENSPSQNARGSVLLDDVRINETQYTFDRGDLEGWKITSGKFEKPVADRQHDVSRPEYNVAKQGYGFLSTGDLSDGTVTGKQTGEIVSPNISIRSDKLSFVVGGAPASSKLFVLVETRDGKEIWRGGGRGNETTRVIELQTAGYIGQDVRVRVVDNDPSNFITLDGVFANQGLSIGDVTDLTNTRFPGEAYLQWAVPQSGTILKGTDIYRSDLSSTTDENPYGTLRKIGSVEGAGNAFLDRTVKSDQGYVYAVVPRGTLNPESNRTYTIARKYINLFAAGTQKVYSGENLTNINFPVGAIGDQGFFQDGRGKLAGFGDHVESFFAIRSGDGRVAALQSVNAGKFAATKNMSLTAKYPVGEYHFGEAVPGIEVDEEFMSGFVPGDTKNSSIPAARYLFKLKNTSNKAQNVSLLTSKLNEIGWNGRTKATEQEPIVINGRKWPAFQGQKNEITQGTGGTAIRMTGTRKPEQEYRLSTTASGTTATASYASLDALYSEFSRTGAVSGETSSTAPNGSTTSAAMASTVTIAPGATVTIPVTFSWWHPDRYDQPYKTESIVNGQTVVTGHATYGGRYYTTLWKTKAELDAYIDANFDDVYRMTKSYSETLYDSNVPTYLLDRVASGPTSMKSGSMYWSKTENTFGGYEGVGCCDGAPIHVWHYNQYLAALFPEVGNKISQQYIEKVKSDGHLENRPLLVTLHGSSTLDGQSAALLNWWRTFNTYTNISEGQKWVRDNYQTIKKATNWLWQKVDPDRDGIVAGSIQNTLDGHMDASDTWLGGMYLAGINAAQRLAEVAGDIAQQQMLRGIYARGKVNQDKQLWNGQYYEQKDHNTAKQIADINDPNSGVAENRAYGPATAVDSMLGQWWSNNLGLDDNIYPIERQRSTLRAVYHYNHKNNFIEFPHSFRKYVESNDGGTVMFSWPRGGHPTNSVTYYDEVMSGFEYANAAVMIQTGLVEEGLQVMLDANNRYDGRARSYKLEKGGCGVGEATGNPFGDDECGRWYIRAGSSWSTLTALQGLVYEGSRQWIHFAPKFRPEDHRSFFTAGNSWGTFAQKRAGSTQTETVTVKHSTLLLSLLNFETLNAPRGVTVTIDGKAVPATFTSAKNSTGSNGWSVQVKLSNGSNSVNTGSSIKIELLGAQS